MKKFSFEIENEEITEKVKDFLNNLEIDFEIEDDELERDELVETFKNIKVLLEENGFDCVDVYITSHYHPDYNADEISFVPKGYRYGYRSNNSDELEDLHEDLNNIFYDNDFDLYRELYSLDVDFVQKCLNEAGINYSEILESSDSDH